MSQLIHEQSSFSKLSIASPMSQLIHEQSSFSKLSIASPMSQLIHEQSSFSKLSIASPMSQLIHEQSSFFKLSIASPMSQLIHEQSSFSKLYIASPMSQLILQSFLHFTYITAHSPTLPSLYLRHSSFSNPSFASLTSEVFTYVTWRAPHGSSVLSSILKCCEPIFENPDIICKHKPSLFLLSYVQFLTYISKVPLWSNGKHVGFLNVKSACSCYERLAGTICVSILVSMSVVISRSSSLFVVDKCWHFSCPHVSQKWMSDFTELRIFWNEQRKQVRICVYNNFQLEIPECLVGYIHCHGWQTEIPGRF